MAPVIGVNRFELIVHDKTVLLGFSRLSEVPIGTAYFAWRGSGLSSVPNHVTNNEKPDDGESKYDNIVDPRSLHPLVLKPWLWVSIGCQ